MKFPDIPGQWELCAIVLLISYEKTVAQKITAVINELEQTSNAHQS